MNEQQPPGGSQNWSSAPYSEAIARELGSLKQALDHLATIERDLERQRVQLQAQITRYTEQAPLARQANRHDLANEALARAAQLQPELTRIQEQMSRVVARQREITNRQFDLLRQANALGSEQIAPVSDPYPYYYPQSPYAQPQSP
jgi:phage shock protein A